MPRPASCEFSRSTKWEARKRAGHKCEICDARAELSVHHLLGIDIALKYYPEISHAAIRSLANALCLCSACHNHMDKQAHTNHQIVAEGLKRAMGIQPELV